MLEQCSMKSKQKHLSAGFPAGGMAGRFYAGITAYKTITI